MAENTQLSLVCRRRAQGSNRFLSCHTVVGYNESNFSTRIRKVGTDPIARYKYLGFRIFRFQKHLIINM